MTSHEVLNEEHGTAGDPALSPARRPLRADAERNRQRLLAAATEVFAERGLDASLDDIAARAGVGVGTAYRRFANKEEVIEALFAMRLDSIVALAHDCAAAPSAWTGLVQFLQRTISAMAQDRGFRDILMRQAATNKPVAKDAKVATIRERLLPIVTVLVERAKAEGAVRADFHAQDLPMVILMLEAVTDATDRLDPHLSDRYLALILAGMNRRDPPLLLPGQPLGPAETELAFASRHARA